MNCSTTNWYLRASRFATAFVLFVAFATSAWAQSEPKYKANVPPSVTTPDTVYDNQTAVGGIVLNLRNPRSSAAISSSAARLSDVSFSPCQK